MQRFKPIQQKAIEPEAAVSLPTSRSKDWGRRRDREVSAGGGSDLELFRAILDQFIAVRATRAEELPQRPERLRTPRSLAPMPRMQKEPVLKGKFKGLRLYFNCPGCCRPQVAGAWRAGTNLRCRHCRSALRAPDPRKQKPARLQEGDVETLLHPDKYLPAKKPISYRSALRQIAAVLVLVGLMGGLIFRKLRHLGDHRNEIAMTEMAENGSAAPVTAKQDSPPELTAAKLREAEHLVARFLEARQLSHVAASLVSPHSDAREVQAFLGRAESSRAVRHLEGTGTGFLSLPDGEVAVSHVAVELADGQEGAIAVIHGPEGGKIDWQASTMAGTGDWELGPGFRNAKVFAAPGDYYNFAFNDAANYLCVRLQHPSTNELGAWGYISRADPDCSVLCQLLEVADEESPVPLMVELEALPDSSTTKQVRILRILSEGWHSTAKLASK